jgi:hypothetical protein
MEDYHLSRGGRTLGVYPEDRIREYIAQGRVAATDLVWKTGMANWVPAADLFHFAPQPTAPLTDAYAAQAIEPAVLPPARAVPAPPNFHWGWVLLLSVITLGLFYIVWAFVQAVWVKRMDSSSNALALLAIYLVLTIAGEWLADTAASKEAPQVLAGALLSLAGAVASIFAFFSMRRSLLARYGDGGIESTGLKLGRVMTFFFNVLYFQHHLTRIARRAKDPAGDDAQPT